MLNIKITGVDKTTGRLKFKVNGSPSNSGNGGAKRNWQVHWMVASNKVLSIADIKMKTGPGAPASKDIFSECKPARQDEHGKHWMAKVSENAPIFAEYNYDIKWVSASGVETHDPKISVMPSVSPSTKLLIAIVTFIAGCLTLRFLQKKIKR